MSQFPSPADSAAGSGFKTSPKTTYKLYPDLGMVDPEEDDILVALGAPPSRSSKKPPPRRPPPPRSQSLPLNVEPPVPEAVPQSDTVSHSLPPARPHAPPLHSKASSETNVYMPPPLHAHEVRWFYQEPGKYWQPFNGQDSLNLEDCYRRMETDRKQGSGAESASCYDITVLGDMYEVNLVENACKPIYWAVDKNPWSVLRGCWFEVIGDKWYPLVVADYELIEKEHCQKKWREKARRDAELQLWANSTPGTASPSNSSPGTVHRQQSNSGIKRTQSSSQEPNTVDPSSTIVNKLSHTKYDVLWMSNGDIIKMKRELTSQLLNKVGEKFGKGTTNFGTSKLARGYKEPASREDRTPPIGHVVFVVHGIGQNMDISCITKSTNDLRETAVQVAKKCFKDEWEEKRVEFIPVEWRTWLTLDKGVIGNITLHGVPMMRKMINDSVLDVMYYLSPKFRPEILDGLKFQLHKQYNAFMKHHPHFLSTGGTVSIIGHSLGSVISYDLLLHTAECMGVEFTSEETTSSTKSSPGLSKSTMTERCPRAVQLANGKGAGGGEGVWFDASMVSPEASLRLDDDEEPMVIGEDEPDSTAELERRANLAELEQLKKRVAELEEKLQGKKKGGLKFKVDHFFALGSPLGMFLAMREHEALVRKSYKGAASLLPTCVCKRIHNLHHPSDPVAYRLEPLVNQLYANIKPVKVDSAGSKHSKDLVDLAQGPRTHHQLLPQSKGWLDTFSSWVSGSKKPASQGNSTDGGKPKPDKVVDSDDKLHPEEKLLERLDFMLREGFVENSYMNSITAHNGYWSSSECAQFILLQIYKFRQGGCS